MEKDAYYFSHDANAQDDPKCMILIDQLGMEGYGIFWALIERLRQEKDYKLPTIILPALAKRWNTSNEKIQTVISKYGLFVFENEKFYSTRLERSMKKRTKIARDNALKRWKLKGDATAMQLHSNCNATAMLLKERKVKESKDIYIPDLPEFLDQAKVACRKAGLNYTNLKFSLESKYELWRDAGWKDGYNKPIKKWKSKLNGVLPHLKEITNIGPAKAVIQHIDGI